MQMVKKSFILFLLAWVSIIVFMPKQAFYYKLEEALAKQEIVLNEEKIEEGLFSLTLEKVTLYFKGIPVATIDQVDLFTLLFYSHMELQALSVDDSLKRMVPQETQEARIIHTLVSPVALFVDASGSFGAVEGVIDLTERSVRLDFNESKNIQMLRPQLKKGEKGWVYETSF